MTYEDVNMKKFQNYLHEIVETGMRSATRSIIAHIDRLIQQNSVPRRELNLQFINKISQPILTGDEIKGEGDTSIEVILIDTCTGCVVEVGPEASASVEIVVLKGDEVDACVVNGIKFRNHTMKINQNMFRLGARFVDPLEGIQVKEAKTEVFATKDFRNKYKRKHDVPSLSDEVWRLQNIQKGGKIHDRLRNIQVFTVEEFLTQLLINPDKLKEIVKFGPKKWEVTVNHARTCSMDQRRYCYINFQQKTGIVFDRLGNVLGLILKGCYTSANFLSSDDKVHIEEFMSSAIENWKDTPSFDNEVELEHYLSLFISVNPPSSSQPEHSSGLQPRSSKITSKDGCAQLKSSGPIPGVESAHNHPLDSFRLDNTGLLDKPRPPKKLKSSQWDEARPRAEDVPNNDFEIEHGNPMEATNSIASMDQVGPSGVTDECSYGGLEKLVSDVGYMPSLEYPLHNPTVVCPDFNPYHMQWFDNNPEFSER